MVVKNRLWLITPAYAIKVVILIIFLNFEPSKGKKMKQVLRIYILIIFSISQLSAQESDTTQFIRMYFNDDAKTPWLKSPYTKFIIPSVFISYGIIAKKTDCLQRFDQFTYNTANKRFTDRMYMDDYFQYFPAVAVYGVDLIGGKAKHNFRDRTLLMASAYLFSTASVQILKRTTHIKRPDETDDFSFPSGHTATAFVGAHLLFKEYQDKSPWIGIAGYIVASGTGALRIMNRKHWVSDVIAGAGFGILSVEISYLLLPTIHRLAGIIDTKTSLTIAPVIGNHHYGVGCVYTF